MFVQVSGFDFRTGTYLYLTSFLIQIQYPPVSIFYERDVSGVLSFPVAVVLLNARNPWIFNNLLFCVWWANVFEFFYRVRTYGILSNIYGY